MNDIETPDTPASETSASETSASELPAGEPPVAEEPDVEHAGHEAGRGTGAGQSDAPQTGIGAQDSLAINANLSGLAAGTIRLVE